MGVKISNRNYRFMYHSYIGLVKVGQSSLRVAVSIHRADENHSVLERCR